MSDNYFFKEGLDNILFVSTDLNWNFADIEVLLLAEDGAEPPLPSLEVEVVHQELLVIVSLKTKILIRAHV